MITKEVMKKMKRNIILAMLICTLLLVVGCSKGKSTTMDDFISSYEEQGIEIDKNEKPIFAMIGATDNYTQYFADINGDGRTDLIQVNKTTNMGKTALANAEGTFSN